MPSELSVSFVAPRPRRATLERALLDCLQAKETMGEALNDWTTCARVNDVATAHVLKSTLDAAGIDCVIPDQNMASVAWHLGQAIGGVRVQVRADRVEQAREILEAEWSEEPADDESSVDELSGDGGELASGPPGPTGDSIAYRAFKASVLGSVLLPMLPYAFLLSLRAASLGELSARGRRHALLAGGISLIAMSALGVTYGLLR